MITRTVVDIDKELAKITIACEICHNEPGKDIIGGVVKGIHGLWLVGDRCKIIIKDRRK